MKQINNFWGKIKSWIEGHEALVIILLITAILRLPSLSEPNRYADEDIYLTIGLGLRHGLTLYKDIFDNKTPFIYLVAALAGNVMWFRFILLVWNLVNVGLVWKLSEKLIGKRWSMVAATMLFAVFSTLPLLEGEIANGEIFMIMPTVAAIYLLLDKSGNIKQNKAAFFWSGICWAIAFLFKVPVASEFFGIGLFLLFFENGFILKTFKDLRIWLLGLGFILPVLISLVYFWLVGAGKVYLQSVFLQNIPYLSSWGGGGGVGGGGGGILTGGMVTRVLILVAAYILVFWQRKRLSSQEGLLIIWVTGALFGALLSGRPYPHYLLEIVAPLSLFVGLVIVKRTGWLLVWLALFTALVAGSVLRYQFWHYKSLPYYLNYWKYITKQKTREQYFGYWGDNVVRNIKAAAFIDQISDDSDKIFVWGTEPAIYVLSRRLPAVKYVVTYHIVDFNAKEEVISQLERNRPKVIVVLTDEKERFSQLAGLLAAGYVQAKETKNLKIYLRLK